MKRSPSAPPTQLPEPADAQQTQLGLGALQEQSAQGLRDALALCASSSGVAADQRLPRGCDAREDALRPPDGRRGRRAGQARAPPVRALPSGGSGTAPAMRQDEQLQEREDRPAALQVPQHRPSSGEEHGVGPPRDRRGGPRPESAEQHRHGGGRPGLGEVRGPGDGELRGQPAADVLVPDPGRLQRGRGGKAQPREELPAQAGLPGGQEALVAAELAPVGVGGRPAERVALRAAGCWAASLRRVDLVPTIQLA
mmetsp:Transcript_30021/g.94037  ORF Transcript_30021/g.94037 Transcript_30021/m.94037 type:complete len:254 (+) Transcript_30021:837-1598(+)